MCIREYFVQLQEEYCKYKQFVLFGEDKGFGQLTHKLEIALSSDAFDNDSVIK
jgi:hypothetical protein